MVIAQDSGNRVNESQLAAYLCKVEAQHGDPLAALNYFALAIRNSATSPTSNSTGWRWHRAGFGP